MLRICIHGKRLARQRGVRDEGIGRCHIDKTNRLHGVHQRGLRGESELRMRLRKAQETLERAHCHTARLTDTSATTATAAAAVKFRGIKRA